MVVKAEVPPQLIAIGGLSGTGKSMLARMLAADLPPHIRAAVLRSDLERKRMFGRAATDPLPPEAYSTEATAHVYAALTDKARRIAAAGEWAIVDAVFARPAERAAIAEAAAEGQFHGLFLVADLATRIARVAARKGDASDADAEIVRQQQDYDLGHNDWSLLDASGSPAETLARARAVLTQIAG